MNLTKYAAYLIFQIRYGSEMVVPKPALDTGFSDFVDILIIAEYNSDLVVAGY